MRAAIRIAGLLAALLALPAAPARADDLVSGLSQDQIEITSNYTGTDLVVFGAIESRNQTISPAPRDVVVVVRGPDVTMTVRQKDRVAGLWINRHEVTLTGMPGYYYLASTRPLDKIADKAVLARYQLGLANLDAGRLLDAQRDGSADLCRTPPPASRRAPGSTKRPPRGSIS